MRLLFTLIPFLPLALAHGGSLHDPHDNPDPSLPWAERHMISEHHILNYDAGAFFSLHDFNNDGYLSRDELLRTYGLASVDKPPPAGHKSADEIWAAVRKLVGPQNADRISRDEWTKSKVVLPDFGTGPGHHGDDEWEYEIHHFEKFHSNDKEDGSDMVMHPEDVEHVGFYSLSGELEPC